MISAKLKLKLIDAAYKKRGVLRPIPNLHNSFIDEMGVIRFWYNYPLKNGQETSTCVEFRKETGEIIS